MKPKYMLLKYGGHLKGYYVIKRLSGGSVVGRKTITKYEILYPIDLDPRTKRFIRYEILGDGRSRKGTLYKTENLHDSLRGIFKDLFER